MTEKDFEVLLADAIWEEVEEREGQSVDIRSFEEAGILTYNKGLVVRLKDGTEFQLTIVRSN